MSISVLHFPLQNTDKSKVSIVDKQKNSNGIYYLGMVFVVLIWGIFPVLTKKLFTFYTPSLWDTAGSMIAVISLLILGRKKLKQLNWDYFKVAVPTGLFFSAACLTQKFGLTMTTPAMFAFLENLTCVFVPLLMLLFVKQKLTLPKILAALLCLAGVFALCSNGLTLRFGPGEILCGLAGVFYAVNIAGTSAFGKKLDTGLYLLIQFSVHGIISAIYSILFVDVWKFSFAPQHLISLVSIVLISTVLCWMIRTACLKRLDPSFVAIIMPFSSVVTSVVSIWAGTDTLSAALVIGAILMFAAIMLSGLADSFRTSHKKAKDTAE